MRASHPAGPTTRAKTANATEIFLTIMTVLHSCDARKGARVSVSGIRLCVETGELLIPGSLRRKCSCSKLSLIPSSR